MLTGKNQNTLYGETIIVSSNWTAEVESRGTTVSSSAWAFNGSATLGTAALTGSVATQPITPSTSGVLTNTATLGNGEVLMRVFDVQVAVLVPTLVS